MQIIDNLYNAFADVPRPIEIDGCRHCIPEDDIQTLLGQDLRHASPELLWHYIDDAMWTVGNALDFKYYVPRLLDLGLTAYDSNGHEGSFIWSPEMFGKKLALAGFDDWDEDKRNAVDDAILAIVIEEAGRGDFYRVDGWVCAICNISVSKTRYLNFLDSEAGHKARDSFLVNNRNAYNHNRMKGPFWDEFDVERTSLIFEWLGARKEESNVALGKHRRACQS